MGEAICQECGMLLDDPNEYHPYAACLMFKGCHSSRIVKANMDAVMAHALQYHNAEADRLAAIERQVLWRTDEMPAEAVAWFKEGKRFCSWAVPHPHHAGIWHDLDVAPDYRPDEEGPLFLPILDPLEE